MDEFVVPLRTPCVYHDPNFIPIEESEQYYQELLHLIPWKKTPKINRWVHLCQAATTDLTVHETDDDVSDSTKITAAIEEASVSKGGVKYSYRDNPNASSTSSSASPSDSSDEIPPFPESVEKIRRACQQWYQQKQLQKMQEGKKDPSSSTTNTTDPAASGDVTSTVPSFNVCLLNFYEDGNQRIGWHSDREELGRTTPICSVSLGTTRQFQIRSKQEWDDQATIELKGGSLVVMENLCQQNYLHAVPRETNVLDGRINLTFRCKNDEEDETTAGEELHRQRDTFMDHISEGTTPTTQAWTYNRNQNPSTLSTTTSSSSSTTSVVFGEMLRLELLEQPAPSSVVYMVKTNLGAERYCAAEIEERIIDQGWEHSWRVAIRPFDIDGYIAICRRDPEKCKTMDRQSDENENNHNNHQDETRAFESMLLKLQSIHHVMKYLTHFRLRDCVAQSEREETDFREQNISKEKLYEYVKQRLVDQSITVEIMEDTTTRSNGGTFRVTCERIGGPHAWQAPDVEYEIGGAFAEYYEKNNWKPKMESMDIQIRADVIGHQVIIGTQMNIQDLSKGRHFLRYRNAVTLKSNLAYIMVRLANLKPENRLVDPFCGSGTLLLEAQHIFGGTLRCIGMDLSRRSAQGAQSNADAEGYEIERCRFVCSDARGLRRHVDSGDNSVDAIASNLSWGVMTGQNQSTSDLQTLYEVFLRNAWYVLKPYGRVVMLVLRGLQVVRTIQKLSGRYRLVHVNVVRTTNNLPSIIVVEKLPVDEVREALKGQLCYLNQFVDVSPEIYKSIHTEDVWDDEKEKERWKASK